MSAADHLLIESWSLRESDDCGTGDMNIACDVSEESAQKAALTNLTQTAARELGELGVRVNGVPPPRHPTESF